MLNVTTLTAKKKREKAHTDTLAHRIQWKKIKIIQTMKRKEKEAKEREVKEKLKTH